MRGGSDDDDGGPDRLQSVLDSFMDPQVILESMRDDHGKIIDFLCTETNQAAAEYFRTTRDELLHHRLRDLVPAQFQLGLFDQYVAVVETGTPLVLDDFEYVATPGDGSRHWLDIRATSLGDGLSVTWRDTTARVQARADRHEQDLLFRLMAENASDVIFLGDLDFNFVWFSPSVTPTFGWDPAELVGRSAVEFIHPDDLPGMAEQIAKSDVDSRVTFRFRFKDKAGNWHWTSTADRGFVMPDGREVRAVWMRDVDEQVQAELDLADREAQFRLIAENAKDVVFRADADGTITWVSPSVTTVLGWRREDFLAQNVVDLIHPEDRQAVRALHKEVIKSGAEGMSTEVRYRTVDHQWRWMAVTGKEIRNAAGAVVAGVNTLRDIQSEVDTRARLEFVVDHDPLTALPNRDRLAHMLADLCTSTSDLAVLCIGADGLHEVNDALTHTAGDRVIATIARRLTRAAEADYVVARSAGNEFVVLVPNISSATAATDTAVSLQDAARGQVRVGPHVIDVSVSVGIALADGSSSEELLRNAAAALHQAKNKGRNQVAFLNPEQAAEALNRLVLHTTLQQALTVGEVHPWFQPIVSLENRKIKGYEALARWRRGDDTFVYPDDFIPIAEHTGLIVELDQTILWQALTSAADLPADTHMAVNVSAATLLHHSLLSQVTSALAHTRVKPTRLHLEVTETSLFQLTDEVLSAMLELREIGVTWWVDDFGTGYSSVAHLRDLPVQGLKLDRSFTAAIDGRGEGEQLPRGLIGLAHGLGLDTVAEGVETAEQAAVLWRQRWDCGQGYFFGRPQATPVLTI